MRSLRPMAVVLVLVSSFVWADPPAATDVPRAVQLEPGATAPVTLDVTEKVPLHMRWQVWTAVGAMVAVTVVTAVGVAMAQPRAISPNEVCGNRPCDACIGIACAGSGALKF